MRKATKLNNVTMEAIPPPDMPPAEEIIGKLKRKYKLKEQRTGLVGKIRELRQELYNLSRKINGLEEEIDRILLKKLMREEENARQAERQVD